MARELNSHVHAVQRDKAGNVVAEQQFPAGTYAADLPAWAREAIVNPDVWSGEDDAPAPEPVVDRMPVPPMGGPASSADAWAEYARANDVEVPADAKRGDIIDQLRAAGVPVE